MSTLTTPPTGTPSKADGVLAEIQKEIAVPRAVLAEAKKRRDLVLTIAGDHPAARDTYVSGSVAHGTHNRPLEDTDCGVKINRRYEAFRHFGPDAQGGGEGPEQFVRMFAEWIEPLLAEHGYPRARVDLSGKRAIKFEFNESVEFDDWGVVDPYVDLIVGLSRADGRGLWIPDRHTNTWDPGDPELHTDLMTDSQYAAKAVRVFRARIVRLVKRAVKRDAAVDGRLQVICSWNISALALQLVEEIGPISVGLRDFLAAAAAEISRGLTEDPSPIIEQPIKLPEGVSNEMAARRLAEMAAVVDQAINAMSAQGARLALEQLYGPEIGSIRERERMAINTAYSGKDHGAAAAALGLSPTHKPGRSHGG